MNLKAERRCHWATADTLLIKGAFGDYGDIINGSLEVAERPECKAPIYNRGDTDFQPYVSSDDRWTIGHKQEKHKRKLKSIAYSNEVENGRSPHEVGTAWMEIVHEQWTEQRVRVLHGEEAEAAIAELVQAEKQRQVQPMGGQRRVWTYMPKCV